MVTFEKGFSPVVTGIAPSENMYSLASLEAAASLVYQTMPPTPQYRWPLLAERCGCDVWVKHENHTPLGAFKVRGGLVYFHNLLRQQPDIREVVTATRGNHGQSIALAASRLGIKATVYVPENNCPQKNASMRALGANLVIAGDDFQIAIERAKADAADRNLHFVPSFHPDLVRGVASYSLELFRAVPDLHTVYVPIGQGSGICGMIAARNALGLETRIVGVVSKNAPAYALSLERGELLSSESADTLADGIACRTPNPDALTMIRGEVERIVTVPDEAILEAIGYYFTDTHNLAEGAGAAALAALLQERDMMQGKTVAVILSGGNLDDSLYARALATLSGKG